MMTTTVRFFAVFLSFFLFLDADLFSTGAPLRAEESRSVSLDELDLAATECGWRQTQARKSVEGRPLTVAGKKYERGIGHHAPGTIVVELPAGKVRFSAEVGLDDESDGNGSVEFFVYADGELLWQSGVMRRGEPAKPIDVELIGRRYLALRLGIGPDQYNGDHGDWCDARIDWTQSETKEGAPDSPVIRALPVDQNGRVVDRQNEASLAWYALDSQLRTDNEKIRADYFRSANRTGYNGSLNAMAPPVDEKIADEAVHPAATILPTDRDPLDVLLRRTRTLCDYLRDSADEEILAPESESLAEMEKKAEALPLEKSAERRELFERAIALRRRIALANPLLDFSDILFIKRAPCGPAETAGNHMCDQFFGFQALPGGGLFVLKDAFSDKPEAVDLLEELPVSQGKSAGKKLGKEWSFLAPELSFNADEILFAATDTRSPRGSFTWTEENCFHLFRLRFDPESRTASELVQLTDGPINDFDPCFLPSGRIMFISERRGGYGRCHPRIVPTYTLCSMNPDGSDVTVLSMHETNEWQPVVNADGMVLYTRWDYVDRGANNAHHPWITTPDGRDPRAVTGNYNATAFNRPVFEANIRPVPDSGLFTATAAAHHGQHYGSLLLVDPRIEDDNRMKPIRRITPDQLFPESEVPQHAAPARYGTCFPLSEYFYLCVYDPMARGDSPSERNNYGLYLLDAFGNHVPLYRDETIACYDPIPIRRRETPPVVPHQTLVGKPLRPGEKFVPADPEKLPKTATMAVVNVYDTGLPFPEGTKISRLRVVQLLPKTTWLADDPRIGYGDQKGARQVLGTVPVESDGSAYFSLPVNIPVYFQALDEKGVAVQSMRSDTYVHEGEQLVCQGCHENRHSTSAAQPVRTTCLALRRAPSELTPDPAGSKPMNYPLLIQPILDAKCVQCHADSDDPKAIDLSRGPEEKHFFNSYENLKPFCFYYNHYLWTEPQTIPGKFGSMASPLYKILTSDHYGVKLTPEELYRFTLWLDNNADFYGVYEACDRQKKGEIVQPSLE